MKHIFIVNPISGRANASETLVPQIHAAAKAAGIDYAVELTQAPLHAVQLAKQYASTGEEVRLYACGGDGTMNEVMLGAWEFKNAQVASIPCGSGNDFVRNFGEPEDFLNLKEMIEGVPVTIDLMRTDDGISIDICSAGLDAQVAYGIPKFRRVPLCGGSMAYNLSVVQCVCGHLGHKLRVTVDDETMELDGLMVAVCNGKTYGGGFQAAPEARMDDGLLDVLIVKKISRVKIASVVAAYKNGKHFKGGQIVHPFEEIIFFRRVRKVAIVPVDDQPLVVNVDGECAVKPGLSAEVIPAAGRVVLPRALAKKFAE